MCGISGLLGRTEPCFVDRISPRLEHRGPDDRGIWKDNETTLVHHRLAIQDLSAAGHQPMISTCDRYVIVFNGEIYNTPALRKELLAEGIYIRSHSDTEVLLALYGRYREDLLPRIQGMFAFCIWDIQKQEAFFARDPLGIKPLYFWQGARCELAFASELRALLSTQLFTPHLNGRSLQAYLITGSVPEPDTLVKEIRLLPAGYCGFWKSGQFSAQPYWQPSYTPDFSIDAATAISMARQSLQESVQSHLIGDVPVGVFLSGGLDSSSLLALAQRPVKTFSVGFAEAAYDESDRAAAVAAHFKADHHPLQLSAAQARAWLPEFLAAVDQPTLDGFNTFCVSRLAREEGVKVVLSGLGGDELFGGYPSFNRVPKMQQWRSRLGPLALAAGTGLQQFSSARCQRVATWLQAPPTLNSAYTCYRGIFSQQESEALLSLWGLSGSTAFDSTAPYFATDPDISSQTPTDQIAWLETSRYMRNQLLRDSDVFSMAWGLELRVPFVDRTLLESLSSIPAPIRLATGKQLLSDSVTDLPRWLLNKPKQGFTFPFQDWLNDMSAEELNLPPVPASFDLHQWYRRWTLFILNNWLKTHLDVSL